MSDGVRDAFRYNVKITTPSLCDECGGAFPVLTYQPTGLADPAYRKYCKSCLDTQEYYDKDADYDECDKPITRTPTNQIPTFNLGVPTKLTEGIKFDSGKEHKMTKKEYFEFHQSCIEKMSAITKAKNADYTGIGDDPFANFTRVEALGVCTTEQGFLTRMVDKLARINSFAQKGQLQVKDESVEDTLLDLANYAILFAGYIKSKK